MITIRLNIKKFNYALPYDYYYLMHAYITKLMGDNCYGKNHNRYLYTNLIGGENTSEGIIFNDCYFLVRFPKNDTELLSRFWANITSCQKLFKGLEIENLSIHEEDFSTKKYFRTIKQSPILIAQKYDKCEHLDNDFIHVSEEYLMRCVKNKARACGFVLDERLSIKIHRVHNNKTINYRGINNHGRVFELEINANEETKKFILTNGLGRSCGCGFGFIY